MRCIKGSLFRTTAALLSVVVLLSAVLLLTACRKNEEAAEDDQSSQALQDIPVVLEEFSFTYGTDGNFPRMDGSPATAPLAQAAACVLLGESRENVGSLTMFTRTTQAFRNLAAGVCDILIVSEPASGVLSELAAQSFNVEMTPIAVDALVFVVSKSNPVESLTATQLRDIYSGKISNWQQVGGTNLEITAFQRNEEAGSQVLMQKLVMDGQSMMDAPMKSFSVGLDMGEQITTIKGFDGSAGAIGYTMFYYADEMEMAEGLKIISVDGITPGTDTLKSGAYPFLNPYYAVIDAGEPEDSSARLMFNWLLSDAGQALISREGYVSMMDLQQSGNRTQPEMSRSIKTDDSKLTPFVPPYSMHTRLNEGEMPALVPSNTYGTMLPYSSAVTMNDGSLNVTKYGFVTIDGTIVTDLIYDNIERAVDTTSASREPQPAYHLQLFTDEPDDFGFSAINAVCALDGSWITGFDYVDIVFTGEVIFLLRDHLSFDIDVYNYNGRMLYNVSELEWASDIPEEAWAGELVYGTADGLAFIKLSSEIYGLMDVTTGEIRRTNFTSAYMFSEGLAAVSPRGGANLWGFANKDLEIVIPPRYVYATTFLNNRAVVETPDGKQHIIDKQGEQLFSVTSEYFIIMNHDGNGFSVHLKEGWDFPTFYNNDFTEIELPANAVSTGPESIIQYLNNGWYFNVTENGVLVFSRDESYLLPPDRYLIDFVDGYIIYSMSGTSADDQAITIYGVMLPDSWDVSPPLMIESITPAMIGGGVAAFIMNTRTLGGSFVNEAYTQSVYNIVELNGGIIKTGPGILSFARAPELYYVQGTDHFAWLDKQGKTLISIPSMAYSFD